LNPVIEAKTGSAHQGHRNVVGLPPGSVVPTG